MGKYKTYVLVSIFVGIGVVLLASAMGWQTVANLALWHILLAGMLWFILNTFTISKRFIQIAFIIIIIILAVYAFNYARDTFF